MIGSASGRAQKGRIRSSSERAEASSSAINPAVERADFLPLLVVGPQALAREAARGFLKDRWVFGQSHVQQPETIEWNS